MLVLVFLKSSLVFLILAGPGQVWVVGHLLKSRCRSTLLLCLLGVEEEWMALTVTRR